MKLVSLSLRCIQISRRERALNGERVEALMESISKIGLRSPITVRIVERVGANGVDKEEIPVLVAGLHRLEALKRLGFESVECFIEAGSELDAQLWEIDENLCRSELTELERAEHLHKRKVIYERIHPESRQGGLPGAPGGGKVKTANVAGFAADTAKKTGISERTTRRALRRAENIHGTVRDHVRHKREISDSGAELDALASMPAEQQKQAIAIIEAGEATTVRAANMLIKKIEQVSSPAHNALPQPVAHSVEVISSDGEPSGQQPEDDDVAWAAGVRRLIPLMVKAIVRLDKIPELGDIENLLVFCRFKELADLLSKRCKGEVQLKIDFANQMSLRS